MLFRVMSRTILIAASLASLLLGAAPASAMKLSPEQNELYTSVSINPPSPNGMTVCYGFVCRRRAELTFTAADQMPEERRF
ncbi:hypothetical protein BH10PSE10_BH10PSE10_09490 [soil metagenome]